MTSSKLSPPIVALCIALISALFACGDRFESSYPSLADADKHGAITRGWVPDDLLPPSSRAIHVVGELSPSTEWCAFDFLSADSQVLRKNLKSIDALPPSVRHMPTPGVSWWPAVLKGDLSVEKIHSAGFELYIVERPETSVTTTIYLFAIDWPGTRGFFFTRSESK
jgi:hypothetical protein